MSDKSIGRVLTIAGSDSGGGAGIEADLKTFSAFGVYGMAAVTSITVQDTCRVHAIHDVPAQIVARQIDVVSEDIGIDAAKTGMLSSAAIVEAVTLSVVRNRIDRLVVDPVMLAKGGDALLQDDARDALINMLIPRAYIVTPNVAEAQLISGIQISGESDLRAAAERIQKLGAHYVLMKGGHLRSKEAVDYLFDGEKFRPFSAPRIATRNTHGTGCTYSAAIAACLAKGANAVEAVQRAKDYVTEAIRHSLSLGRGHGPLDHAWALRLKPPQ